MLTTSVHKRALLIALTAAAFSPSSFAQVPDYPNKPIRVVVTFPPGGSSDAMLRVMAPRIADKLGQQLVIDNKPGAGGNIGLALVSKAAPTAIRWAWVRLARWPPMQACTRRCPSMR